jgi:hypothetical protein
MINFLDNFLDPLFPLVGTCDTLGFGNIIWFNLLVDVIQLINASRHPRTIDSGRNRRNPNGREVCPASTPVTTIHAGTTYETILDHVSRVCHGMPWSNRGWIKFQMEFHGVIQME